MSAAPSQRDGMVAALLFVGLFAVYAAGACPSIYVGDSGELVTAVHLLGIPHPSGYPLYVLLGKPWTLLVPVGSIAWRMSLFSALFAAGACALLYRLGRNLGLGWSAALLAALLLAFAPSFWGEANVQRVYSLNAFFVVAAVLVAERWQRERRERDLQIAFLLCGLGATNHTVMLLVAVALGVFAVAVEPGLVRRPRSVALAGAAFALGLLPYLYMPIRARFAPPLNWGDPETLGAFLRAVTRRDFWERSWVEGVGDLVAVAIDYLRSFGVELTWLGAALAASGVVAAWRRARFALLPLLVAAVNLTALCLHGSRSDIFIWHRYYIPSYAMAALLAGFGAEWLLERAPAPARLFILAIPLFLLATGWREVDRSRYRIADDFSRELLRGVPPGASLAATDDNILFVLIYLHFVEGIRPDVNLILQGVGGANLPSLHFNPETDPLHFTHHPNWSVRGLEIVPQGLTFRAWREGLPPPAPVLPKPRLDGEIDPRVPKDYLTQNLIGQYHYMIGVTLAGSDWLAARRELALAAEAAPDNDVLFFNLGLIYRQNGLIDDAIAAFRRSHEINPKHLASESRPRAADRIADLEAEKARLARVEAELAGDPGLKSLAPGPASFHEKLARLLEERGEAVAARGHRLQALQLPQ